MKRDIIINADIKEDFKGFPLRLEAILDVDDLLRQRRRILDDNDELGVVRVVYPCFSLYGMETVLVPDRKVEISWDQGVKRARVFDG